jgi:hypothetical protein
MYRKTLIMAVSACALGACATGTKVSSGGEVAPATPVTRDYLPPGTTMTARLDQSISTSNHEGDAFAATVTNAVYAQDGTVAIPAGAMLRGHVTGIHTSNLPTDQNVIRLDFDELRMNGRSYPFSASISNVDVQNQGTGGIGSNTARDAATGAAAGAVLGAVLSGGELSKIITGGLLGAAAGTVISMGTGGGNAVIPAGSTVTVRSNQGVQIR